MASPLRHEEAHSVQLWDRAPSSLAPQAAVLDTVGKAKMGWLRLAFRGDNIRKLHGELMSEVAVSSSLNLALNI